MALKSIFLVISFWVFVGACCSGGQQVRIVTEAGDCDFSMFEQNQIVTLMTKSIVTAPFLKAEASEAEKALWLLGSMSNDTDEHINTVAVMESIQAELIRTGKVRFVDQKIIDHLLAEEKNSTFHEPEIPKLGKLSGARFLLRATISNIRKSETEKVTHSFIVTYQVVDLLTNQYVWAGEFSPGSCVFLRQKTRDSLHLKNRK